MKKYLAIFYTLASLYSPKVYAQINGIEDFLKSKFYTYSPQENNGNVLMIISNEYQAKEYFGELIKDETIGIKNSQEKFDEMGRCIEYKCTNKGWWGTSIEAFEVSYFENDSMITIHGTIDGNNIKAEYYLDSQSNILKKIEFKNDTILELEKATYNTKGLITGYEQYGKDGLLNIICVWKYDSLDKIIAESSTIIRMPFYEIPTLLKTSYEYVDNKLFKSTSVASNLANNALSFSTVTMYNDKEDVSEEIIIYFPNVTPPIKTNYYYNNDGEMTRMTRSKAETGDEFIEYDVTKYYYEKPNEKPKFNFDPDDVIRKMNGILLNTITYKYNNINQLYCEEELTEGISMLEKKSKKLLYYDAKGNLIKTIFVSTQNLNEAFENLPKTVTERTITYRN
jgi:hypothetical protein